MAEESGKGIALVILGIVAIIAVVGLVLLFTGARKAVGEFAVPGVKEYGGAIKGIYDPYARAFAGRAYEATDSGVVDEFSAQNYNSAGTSGTSYGGINPDRGVSNPAHYNRVLTQAPAVAFQAYDNQGTVKTGDSCYIYPEAISGLSFTSSPDQCSYAQMQGLMRSTIQAWCTGDVSRSRIQSSGGYGSAGQSVVAVDPYDAKVSESMGKACAIVSMGLNTGYGSSGIVWDNNQQ